MRMWSSILLWRVLASPILLGLQSGRFTLNQLWNEGVGEFFRQWQPLMQGVEHIDDTLSHVERVKAHRGEGWPDIFADGEIIGANEGHLLWYLYAEASKRTEQDHRVLGMCQSLAIVAGAFLAQALVGSAFWMFMAPAVVALITVLILVFVLRDRTLARDQQLPRYGIGEFLRSFWVNPLRYPDFGWNWLGRFLFMGAAMLITYQVFYLIDHLHMNPNNVAQLVFISTLVNTIFLVLSSYLGGWLSDRAHRRKIFVIIAALIYTAGIAVVALVSSFDLFLVAIAICGIGQGTYFAVDLALAAAVLPEGGKEAAKDLGVLNIANALPQSIAPAIAPIFLAIGGGGNYTALFIAAAVFALFGALSIQPVKGVR